MNAPEVCYIKNTNPPEVCYMCTIRETWDKDIQSPYNNSDINLGD